MAAAINKHESAADRQWGYRFGVDGVVCPRDAMARLSIGRTTLWRKLRSGLIRYGKEPGDSRQSRVRICSRSLEDYIKGLER
jgi:hypothetical protein